ncbi:MAG: hypothetical protein R3C55_00865 [Parvularculaceae bacterium]
MTKPDGSPADRRKAEAFAQAEALGVRRSSSRPSPRTLRRNAGKISAERALSAAPWPKADPSARRGHRHSRGSGQRQAPRRIEVPANADNASVEKAALSDADVLRHIEGKTVRKIVVVPGRIVNIVVG